MNENCLHCTQKNNCPEVIEYGSIACMVERWQSNKSKGEAMEQHLRFCSRCGRKLED